MDVPHDCGLIDKSSNNFRKCPTTHDFTSAMAFRKRNIALSRSTEDPSNTSSPPSSPAAVTPVQSVPGVRPSPIDGRPTTSTGTPSLDGVIAGHAGLPLGNSIFIEESGTTDYAGALLRFYAAEGVVQGHKVHVVGMGEVWGRELPGLADKDEERKIREKGGDKEKMKIAWRYEGLGQFDNVRGALVSEVSLQKPRVDVMNNCLTEESRLSNSQSGCRKSGRSFW